MLDFAVGDGAAVVDGGVGADVGVDDAGAFADDDGAADDGVDDLGGLTDADFALNVAFAVYEAFDCGVILSRTRWLTSSMSSSLPVSIHQPSRMRGWTW